MRKMITILFALVLAAIVQPAFGSEGHDHKKSEKHCEKTVDGEKVHLESVSSRKECKKEGGRWVKHEADHKDKDGHDHSKDDGHKH